MPPPPDLETAKNELAAAARALLAAAETAVNAGMSELDVQQLLISTLLGSQAGDFTTNLFPSQ